MADDNNNSPPNLLQLPDNSIMEANISCGLRFDDDLSSSAQMPPTFVSHYPGALPDPLQQQFVPMIPQMFAINEYPSSQLSLISAATSSSSSSSAPIFTHTTSTNSISNQTSTSLSLSSNLNQTHHDVQSTANNSHLTIPTNSHDNQSNPTNTSTANPSSPLPPQNTPFKINPLNITHPSQYLELLPSIENTYIFDKKLNKVNILLNGSLSGNFFISRAKPDDEAQESKEYDLTFYRRNLFQISCTIRNARDAYYAVTNTNEYSRILSLKLGISVTGSDETKPIKLLYSPPKNGSNNATSNPSITPSEIEPNLKRVFINDRGYDEVVDWKRLQFSSATAHNGRKRLQNFFTITVTLYAELENTQRIELIKSHSRPIVVRGRNPRFYQLRENIPLSENPLINRAKPFKSYNSSPNNDFKSGSNNSIKMTNNTVNKKRPHSGDSSTPSTPIDSAFSKNTLAQSSNSEATESKSTTTTPLMNVSRNPHKRLKTSETPLSIYDQDTKKYNYDDYDMKNIDTINDQEGNSNLIPPLETSPSSPSSGSEPEDHDQSEEQSLIDPDDVLLDHYHTYQYIAIDHAYWSPPVEVVYCPHATKHMFPTQQQLDQQIEAQHQQLIGGKGINGASIGLNNTGITLKRKIGVV